MMDCNVTSSFASEVNHEAYKNASKMNPSIPNLPTEVIIIMVILFILCFLGLFGNGKVIWILGFHMKWNYFAIYVFNLAVADSGILIMEVLMQISLICDLGMSTIYFMFCLCFLFYNSSQLLLISISVDRCVSVLFPIWQQSHRPPKLSLAVCAISWILAILWFIVQVKLLFSMIFLRCQLIFTWVFSYPVMLTSTLILLVKIKQLQLKRKEALKLTLLALICFIAFRLPLSIFSILNYAKFKQNNFQMLVCAISGRASKEITFTDNIFDLYILSLLSNICIAVNSSINPILYFLAGRNKEERSKLSMKIMLQSIFRNEEDTKEDEMKTDEI
ncbi:PREDICTED: proto-oncogene Mas-like [Thamnophis sirtalis]|uniref:Proto-oncogene Mas-like n=1 Tax=Thamnophis sirtalis TaxID=35019 RepID=A0A6I9YNE6_9SAUR|nr:PREDICTED: proto-oncogene Mas-like [Thamnophis sirtalis]